MLDYIHKFILDQISKPCAVGTWFLRFELLWPCCLWLIYIICFWIQFDAGSVAFFAIWTQRHHITRPQMLVKLQWLRFPVYRIFMITNIGIFSRVYQLNEQKKYIEYVTYILPTKKTRSEVAENNAFLNSKTIYRISSWMEILYVECDISL